MLNYIWTRRHTNPSRISRKDRRALARMARPPRHSIDEQAAKLRKLSSDDQEAVLRLLPTWQAQAIRSALRHPAGRR